MDKLSNQAGTSIKRVGATERTASARQREAEQVELLDWLLAFQHEREPLRPLRGVHPTGVIRRVKKGREFPIPKALSEAIRNQRLQRAREQLARLHNTRAGGALAGSPAGEISRDSVRRFHAWWRDVCRDVLLGAPTGQIAERRLPPVIRVLRIHWRAELVDVARWPHTLKLQAVALLLKFRDRIRTCPALLERGQAQCGRPFVRVRRQEHCSEKCAQRERSRNWYRKNRKKT